ncbi:GtrA family protein [Marinobacteraceae bacterium S3BR75-40.1]
MQTTRPRSDQSTDGSSGWREMLAQPLRFVVTGGLATLIHWLSMALFIAWGISPFMATAGGAVLGAVSNYGLQHRVTFRSQRSHRSALPRYLVSLVLAFLTNQLVFTALHLGLHVQVALAQLLTTGAVAVLNYRLYERLVFHDKFCKPTE